VALASSRPALDLADSSVDRFVSAYVLDLLAEPLVRQVLAEAGRVLRPEGLLCVAGITHGVTPFSRLVMSAWEWLFARNPSWVGGCRPTRLERHLPASDWNIRFRTVVVSWGVASEVVVAARH